MDETQEQASSYPVDGARDSVLNRLAGPTSPEAAGLWLAALVNSSDDAILSKTLDGIITSWNPAAQRIYGYAAEEIIGQSVARLIPPDRLGEFTEIMHQLRQGQRIEHFETIRVRRDGRRIEVAVTISPIIDAQGQIIGASTIARDITERKRVEAERDRLLKEVQESRHLSERIAETSPDVLSVFDLDTGCALYISARSEQVIGYTAEQVLALGDQFATTLWHPADLPTRPAHLRKFRELADRELYEFEHRLLQPDHTYRWLRVRTSVFTRDADRQVRQVVGIMQDITQQKQAEAALRASETKFAKVFHAGPLVLTITKLTDGRFVEVNETFVQMTGYTREEALGRTPVELGLWVESAQRAEGLAQLRAGRFQRNTEARFRMKDGSLRTCLISAELIELNQEPCVVTVLNDITERKQAEQRLQFLADVSNVLATSLDDEVTLQQVAALLVPQLADFCTVEILSARGTIDPVAFVHRDPNQAHWVRELRQRYPPAFNETRGIAQVIRTGVAAFYPEIQEERLLQFAQDEKHKILLHQAAFHSVIIVPLQVRAHTFGALTLVWSTDQHRYTEEDLRFAEEVARRAALAVDNARLYRQAREAEIQLKQLNATLERQVEERTAELQRSNRELDQFAYVASHDLRSPLRGIEHLVYFISEDAADRLPEPSQKHLATLRGRVKRMDALLTDLLAYSRAGRQKHPIERVEPVALVRSVVELVAPPPGFLVRVVEPLPTLITERIPLESILRNLIDNAIKHHHCPAAGQVTIAAQVIGSFIEFTVADDGPGIDPAFHARIFEIFQTLKPRDEVEGSGIGLTLVRRLVESRGGHIGVESSPSHGATFRFTWPV